MGLAAAAAQLFVVAAILTVGTLFTRHHVATLLRADFSHSEYFEDSKAGNGTRYRVVEFASHTGGQSCTIEVLTRCTAPAYLPDLVGSGPEHAHKQQSERVQVRQGQMGYKLQRRKQVQQGVLAAGDVLDIPAGTSHVLFNVDSTTDVLYELTHQPAGPMGEAFFEELAGLGWDYGSVDRIHPLQIVVLFDAAGTQLTDMSGLLAPVVDRLVLPAAKLLGFKAQYSSHRSRRSASVQQVEAELASEGLTDGRQHANEHTEL